MGKAKRARRAAPPPEYIDVGLNDGFGREARYRAVTNTTPNRAERRRFAKWLGPAGRRQFAEMIEAEGDGA